MKSSILTCFIILTIVTLLEISGCDLSNSALPHAREKACYANMRTLMGAIEMYNMDHEKKEWIRKLFINDYLASDSPLISGKYLRKPLPLPEKECGYFSMGDPAEKDWDIGCDLHGTVD